MNCEAILALKIKADAINASIEGMKADNAKRERQGCALAWDGEQFFDASNELEKISEAMAALAEKS